VVPIPPGKKGPIGRGWNTPGHYATTVAEVERLWRGRESWGVGLVHAPSGSCALDVDHVEHTRTVFAELGVAYDEILDGAPRLRGNPERDKALFRLPEGVELSTHKLVWPPTPNAVAAAEAKIREWEQGGGTGEKPQKAKPVTVFELRAGPVQDVLPPSIHPDTGRPYEWVVEPNGAVPELPAEILDLWQYWAELEPMLKGICPWAPAERSARDALLAQEKPRQKSKGSGRDVIGPFNRAHTVEALLERHNYKRKGGAGRWLSPSSSSLTPGVNTLDDGKVFSHHASDPLADGHAHDAFDIYRLLDHGGDVHAAVKAAAKELGLPYKPPARDSAPKNGSDSEADLPEPQPLTRPLPEAPEFPLDALGEVAGGAVRAIQEFIQAPIALCAQSVLAAINLAVQGFADVRIDRRMKRALSLFLVTIGVTGERKSSSDDEALYAVREREEELRNQYEVEAFDFANEKVAWDKKRKDAEREKTKEAIRAKLDALGPPPAAPMEPALTVGAPTIEGLVKAMRVGQPSMGLFSAEGGRFLGGYGLTPEKELHTCASLSSFWDGKVPDRILATDDSFSLQGRRLACHLLVQPGVASRLLSNTTAKDQGLLSRVLATWPATTISKRPYRDPDELDTKRLARFTARMLEILRTPLPVRDERHPNELRPAELPLSAEAKALWVRFHDEVEAALTPGSGPLDPVSGFACKAAEHAARLAGTLSLFDDLQAEEVSAEHMAAGIKLASYYLNEALRLFGIGQTDLDLLAAQELEVWLLESWGREEIALPIIYQRGPNALRDAETARRLCRVLEDHYRLAPLPGGATIDGQHYKEAWTIRRREGER